MWVALLPSKPYLSPIITCEPQGIYFIFSWKLPDGKDCRSFHISFKDVATNEVVSVYHDGNAQMTIKLVEEMGIKVVVNYGSNIELINDKEYEVTLRCQNGKIWSHSPPYPHIINFKNGKILNRPGNATSVMSDFKVSFTQDGIYMSWTDVDSQSYIIEASAQHSIAEQASKRRKGSRKSEGALSQTPFLQIIETESATYTTSALQLNQLIAPSIEKISIPELQLGLKKRTAPDDEAISTITAFKFRIAIAAPDPMWLTSDWVKVPILAMTDEISAPEPISPEYEEVVEEEQSVPIILSSLNAAGSAAETPRRKIQPRRPKTLSCESDSDEVVKAEVSVMIHDGNSIPMEVDSSSQMSLLNDIVLSVKDTQDSGMTVEKDLLIADHGEAASSSKIEQSMAVPLKDQDLLFLDNQLGNPDFPFYFNLKFGEQIDVRFNLTPTEAVWYPARMLYYIPYNETEGPGWKIQIHFEGWKKLYDEALYISNNHKDTLRIRKWTGDKEVLNETGRLAKYQLPLFDLANGKLWDLNKEMTLQALQGKFTIKRT